MICKYLSYFFDVQLGLLRKTPFIILLFPMLLALYILLSKGYLYKMKKY